MWVECLYRITDKSCIGEGQMKRLMIAMVLVLAISFLIFGQAKKQAQATSAEQELIQLQKEVAEATVKRDVATIDRIITDDSAGTDDEGNVGNKTQLLASLKSGEGFPSSIVVDDIKARVWGDAGVVWMRATEKSQVSGKDISVQYQETNTWIKRSGRWQFVASHRSKVVKN
jgi:hypothetical protein